MRKLLAPIGLAAALGCGAFALNAVMPANATNTTATNVLQDSDDPAAPEHACRPGKPGPGRPGPGILLEALDSLVADGTITEDQKTAILERVKDLAQDHRGDRPGPGHGHPKFHRFLHGAVEIAAATIGVSVDELKAAMQAGQSVASVAEEHGVDPQTVIDALVQAGTEKVDEALANGSITERQAAKIKETLPDIATRFVNHTC